MHVAAAIGVQPHVEPIVRHPPAIVVEGLRDLRLDAAAVIMIAEDCVPALRNAVVDPLERRLPFAVVDARNAVLVEIVSGRDDKAAALELSHGRSHLPLMEGPVTPPVADDHEFQRIAASREGERRRLGSQRERGRAMDEEFPPGRLADRQIHLPS